MRRRLCSPIEASLHELTRGGAIAFLSSLIVHQVIMFVRAATGRRSGRREAEEEESTRPEKTSGGNVSVDDSVTIAHTYTRRRS